MLAQLEKLRAHCLWAQLWAVQRLPLANDLPDEENGNLCMGALRLSAPPTRNACCVVPVHQNHRSLFVRLVRNRYVVARDNRLYKYSYIFRIIERSLSLLWAWLSSSSSSLSSVGTYAAALSPSFRDAYLSCHSAPTNSFLVNASSIQHPATPASRCLAKNDRCAFNESPERVRVVLLLDESVFLSFFYKQHGNWWLAHSRTSIRVHTPYMLTCDFCLSATHVQIAMIPIKILELLNDEFFIYKNSEKWLTKKLSNFQFESVRVKFTKWSNSQ